METPKQKFALILYYVNSDPVHTITDILKLRLCGRGFKPLWRAVLKGHLQPVCIAVVHFTEIICCNKKLRTFWLCLKIGLYLRNLSK